MKPYPAYEKDMEDAYGDPFTLSAEHGEVYFNGVRPDGTIVADLSFTPDEALRVARRLTKAAEVAYAQGAHASR